MSSVYQLSTTKHLVIKPGNHTHTGSHMFSSFLNANVRLCRRLDRWFPTDFQIDGNTFFLRHFAPASLKPNQYVYDLGSGSNPLVTVPTKTELNLFVIGLDISPNELDAAPAGSYDRSIVADLTTYTGNADGDLVICQSTLEHVRNAPGAMKAIASCLKPGATAVIFLPCRKALFARLNLLLPEAMKRRILFSIFPVTNDGHNGFPAHYHKATPNEYRRIAADVGLEVVDAKLFWKSSYFHFFVPLYLSWRAFQFGSRLISGDNACETFAMVLRRK